MVVGMECPICNNIWEPIVVLNAGEILPETVTCPACGCEVEVDDDWEMVEEI